MDESNAIGKNLNQIDSEEINVLRHVTHKVISECVADPGPYDPKTAEETFRKLRIDHINLKPGSDRALVVQGFGACMCGAVGNCPFWLLSEGIHPKLLLSAEGIQTFDVQENRSNKRFHIVLGSHDSAMETDLQQFSFDGTKYRRVGCATVEWADLTGNRLNPPHITAHRCFQ